MSDKPTFILPYTNLGQEGNNVKRKQCQKEYFVLIYRLIYGFHHVKMLFQNYLRIDAIIYQCHLNLPYNPFNFGQNYDTLIII